MKWIQLKGATKDMPSTQLGSYCAFEKKTNRTISTQKYFKTETFDDQMFASIWANVFNWFDWLSM